MSSANVKDRKAYVSRRRRAIARAKVAGKHPRSGGSSAESVAKRQRHLEPAPDAVDVKHQAIAIAAPAGVKPPAAAAAAAAVLEDDDAKVDTAIEAEAAEVLRAMEEKYGEVVSADTAATCDVFSAPAVALPTPMPKPAAKPRQWALQVSEVNGDLTTIPGNTLVDMKCITGKVPADHVDSHDGVSLYEALSYILADWELDVEWELRYANQILVVPYARLLCFESISTHGMTDATMFGALQRVTRDRIYWDLNQLFTQAIVVTQGHCGINADDYIKTEDGRKLMNLLTTQIAQAIERGTMHAHFESDTQYICNGALVSSGSPSYDPPSSPVTATDA